MTLRCLISFWATVCSSQTDCGSLSHRVCRFPFSTIFSGHFEISFQETCSAGMLHLQLICSSWYGCIVYPH
ncbi:hypothetical protein DFH29DRAFT_958532 [Suillus ampliporus]|nr:hypothetical protein DFH29DRAFT_958532 [Suillus ampliporus]